MTHIKEIAKNKDYNYKNKRINMSKIDLDAKGLKPIQKSTTRFLKDGNRLGKRKNIIISYLFIERISLIGKSLCRSRERII